MKLKGDYRSLKKWVTCELKSSDSCENKYFISVRAEQKNRTRNAGVYMCLKCSRHSKHSGRCNPNTRYGQVDDSMYQYVDTEGKAYLLGWIASDGHISRNGSTVVIQVHSRDCDVLQQFLSIPGAAGAVKHYANRNMVAFSLHSKKISQDVCRHLKISPGKKSGVVAFPELPTPELRMAFIRGFFDGDGSVVKPGGTKTSPCCSIATNSPAMREGIIREVGVPCRHDQKNACLAWQGNNALDFMSKLYDGASYYLQRKKNLYLDWAMWVPALSARQHVVSGFKCVKTRTDAVMPSKVRASDSGFDLTLLEAVKQHGDVTFYDTGVRVYPEYGWAFYLVARSSLSKTGYMLANAIGVIDRTYTGNIIAALRKVDKSAPELELPARVVQLIPLPAVHVAFEEVQELSATDRGAGGFGSTGV